MARALRAAFKHHHLYRWDPDEALTKVAIYDSYPLRPMRYPCVVVGVTSGDFLMGQRGIGDEFDEYETTPITLDGSSRTLVTSESMAGTIRSTLSLRVHARTAYDRAQISDWCVLFVRSFAADKFKREGLFVQDITLGGQSEELVGNDPVYSAFLNVVCVSSFLREIPISVFQTVNVLCLTGVFTTIDGATYGDSLA